MPNRKFVLDYGSFRKDVSGAITILWALTLPVMIGFTGLAMDTGVWYSDQRDMQSAADATAVTTGFDVDADATSTSLRPIAEAEANRNGFGPLNDVTVTVNKPPSTGSHTTSQYAVEIILTTEQSRFFSTMFTDEDPTTGARAVSERIPAGNACVLALDPSANDALRFQGNTTVNLNGCIAAANSNSGSAVNLGGDAITLAGSVELNAQNLYTAGTYDLIGASELNTVDEPIENGSVIADPYAHIPNPTFSGCAGGNNTSINNTRTLNPGVYCNGLRLNANARVTLNPGTYYIDRGELRINGGAQITGSNVTIILTSSTGTGYATMHINGGATVNLTASDSGQYEGMLFYQDRRASTSGSNILNGNSTTNLQGAIYIPNQSLDFNGGNSSSSSSCTQIIARTVLFSGNSNLSNSCTGANQSDIVVPGSVRLVE